MNHPDRRDRLERRSRLGPRNRRPADQLRERYPGIAVVAGASEGLGAAFARYLAGCGFPLLLVARREVPLEALASELRVQVAVRTLVCDLGEERAAAAIATDVAGAGEEVGVLVYNAAAAPVGGFLDQSDAEIDAVANVNVAGPMRLIRALVGPPRRQGIVLVSSMAGWQGSPAISTYAASKAFLRVLGEALWYELRQRGVDLVVPIPGATDTPGYRRQSGLGERNGRPIGVLAPDQVVRAAFRALGRRPIVVPGILYKISSFVMTRLVPRRVAIRVMGVAGTSLAGPSQAGER